MPDPVSVQDPTILDNPDTTVPAEKVEPPVTTVPNVQPVIPPSWKDDLDDDVRSDPSMEKFKSKSDLARGYINIQKQMGQNKVVLPGEHATEAERGEFFNKIGRPEKPEGYEIPKIDMPDEFKDYMTPEETNRFKNIAHKMGLTKTQVKELYEYHVNSTVAAYQKLTEDNNNNYARAIQELQTEYGSAYDSKIAQAKNLVKAYGSQEIVGAFGNNPAAIKMLVNIASDLSEDKFQGKLTSTQLTPDQAQAEINDILSDPTHAYHDKNKPGNKEAIEYVHRLFKIVG